jgi:hypothetical protein
VHAARRTKQAALARITALAGEPATSAAAPPTARWPTQAWLIGDQLGRFELPRGQALVRIGRHDDNDVRLADRSVHRHHALLYRTHEGHYILTDLSGRDGNGLIVNGVRRVETRLETGDTITLGNILLRFETQPL